MAAICGDVKDLCLNAGRVKRAPFEIIFCQLCVGMAVRLGADRLDCRLAIYWVLDANSGDD